MTSFQKATLAIAGLTAIAIGAFILVAPIAFYASFDLPLGSSPDLLSDVRAQAANLAALGVVMLAGIVRPEWSRVSVVVAFVVFLAFPLGRFVAIAADGLPSQSMLAALGFELAIAALCLVAFRPGRARNALAG